MGGIRSGFYYIATTNPCLYIFVMMLCASPVWSDPEKIKRPEKVDDVLPKPPVKFTKQDFQTMKVVVKAVAGNASYAAGVASGSTGGCKQKPPVDLKYFRAILPPRLRQFATDKNYNTLMSLFKAANLASAASTGDPIAIMHFILFLASPESPLVPLAEFGEEMLPFLVQDLAAVVDGANRKLNSTSIQEYNEQIKVFGEAMKEETTPSS